MWVCSGANDPPEGSPSAWNPYWSNPPAYGPYTWIGFENASPWLIDDMGTENNIYQYWLVFFYYYALIDENSVMDALDLASQATGFQNYGNSILGTGYETWLPWPPGPDYFSGRMYVCGDPLGTYLPQDEYIE